MVDKSSATLDIVPDPLPLDRRHVLANKFGSPECADYQRVAGKIRDFLAKIREGTLLTQADRWIRTKHYTVKRLEIERLSGAALSMDQCYINLAIIEQPGHSGRSEGPSPFSLPARLNVQELGEDLQVGLSALFDPRKGGHDQTNSRRILIRGRPGVGKTTLCKKIVFEFTQGTWTNWSKLFDRVLWVPLRRLKRVERLQQPGYNFFHLFSHEYFSSKGAEGLARAVSDELDTTKSSRTLFLLDGLDEVSQDISNESDMFRFLEELLSQPNVIITSRPSGKLPPAVATIDIELETIGFYPNQVTEYLERVLPEQSSEVQSFLRDHSLVQDLVRIPIQLDALCFTWKNGFSGKFDTMTTIYRAIEDGLWKKDILRLNKTHAGQPVTESLLQYSDSSDIKALVKDEIHFLEALAFAGLHSDVIDFEPRHQSFISKHLDPPNTIFLAKTLPSLSFLRTSDCSPEQRSRAYHFLHLTYQEYFAARYFVRQWQAGGSLTCPVFTTGECQTIGASNFLRENKYTARYDVFWRFVAGLLDADGMGEQFFTAIEDRPRDLLGPTHQRLVMHCLSEASTEMPLRRSLEERLKEWLLFECSFTGRARLAGEVEFPERSLLDAFQEEPAAISRIINGLGDRATLPPSVAHLICSWLEGDEDADWKQAVLESLKFSRAGRTLSGHLLTALVALALHKDEARIVRRTALWVWALQANHSDEHIEAFLAQACCEDEDEFLRESTLGYLGLPSRANKRVGTVVATLLKDRHSSVRQAALNVLKTQHSLSDTHLEAVLALACKDEDQRTRYFAWDVLEKHTNLSNENLEAVVALVRCGNEKPSVRRAALKALRAQRNFSKERLQAIFIALLEDEEPETSPFDDGEDGNMRHSVLRNLSEQPSLSNERLETMVVSYLKDPDARTREVALNVLQALPTSSLSEERLRLVAASLRDSNRRVRIAALLVLAAQPSLPDDCLAVAVALFNHEDRVSSVVALQALGKQPNLSHERLKLAIALLKNEDGFVRGTALEVLKELPGLSNEHLTAVVALLQDGGSSSKLIAALQFLQTQPNLSDEHLTAVVAHLQDGVRYVRETALEVLRAQRALPDEHPTLWTVLVALLEDESDQLRSGVLAMLRGHPNFYSSLLSGPSAGSLFKALLRHSFEEQCSWYVEDGVSWVNEPEGIRSATIDDMEMFEDMVMNSWPPGIPLEEALEEGEIW